MLREPTNAFDVWQLDSPPLVRLEHDAPVAWSRGLHERGYQVVESPPGDQAFGHAQVIRVTDEGLLSGAADPALGTEHSPDANGFAWSSVAPRRRDRLVGGGRVPGRTIEPHQLPARQRGWSTPITTWISGIDLNNVGFIVVGFLIATWAVARTYRRLARVDTADTPVRHRAGVILTDVHRWHGSARPWRPAEDDLAPRIAPHSGRPPAPMRTDPARSHISAASGLAERFPTREEVVLIVSKNVPELGPPYGIEP